jgi:hypothetical protein
VAAPADGKTAVFAAAEAVRWIEYGLNSLTYSLVGLTLVLVGVALLAGDRFPRWLGAWAAAAGLAYVTKGLVVAYRGFAANPSGLVALVLFGLWVLIMAVFMWRRSSKLTKESTVPAAHRAAARSGTEGRGRRPAESGSQRDVVSGQVRAAGGQACRRRSPPSRTWMSAAGAAPRTRSLHPGTPVGAARPTIMPQRSAATPAPPADGWATFPTPPCTGPHQGGWDFRQGQVPGIGGWLSAVDVGAPSSR